MSHLYLVMIVGQWILFPNRYLTVREGRVKIPSIFCIDAKFGENLALPFLAFNPCQVPPSPAPTVA